MSYVMYTKAFDKNGILKHISEVESGGGYTCPVCGTEMIAKKGAQVEHHFAHKNNVECDPWYCNKGEWHRKMQEMFAVDWREVVIVRNGVRHIADICTTKPNGQQLIIEFQHSPMTYEEFRERTLFYRGNGDGDIIWVFDLCGDEKTKDRDIKRIENVAGANSELSFRWNRAFNTLGTRLIEEVPVFFHMCPNMAIHKSLYRKESKPFLLQLKYVGDDGYSVIAGDKWPDVELLRNFVSVRRYWYEDRIPLRLDNCWENEFDSEVWDEVIDRLMQYRGWDGNVHQHKNLCDIWFLKYTMNVIKLRICDPNEIVCPIDGDDLIILLRKRYRRFMDHLKSYDLEDVKYFWKYPVWEKVARVLCACLLELGVVADEDYDKCGTVTNRFGLTDFEATVCEIAYADWCANDRLI